MQYGITEGSYTHHLVTEEEIMCSECILKRKYFVLLQWISWFRYGNVDKSPVNNQPWEGDHKG
jgi:hypothetical protein